MSLTLASTGNQPWYFFFHAISGADQKLSAQALVCGDAQIRKADTHHTLCVAQKAFTYTAVPRSAAIFFLV